MMKFNPLNREHKAVVISAMVAADALGAGRIAAVLAQLELNDVWAEDISELHSKILEWGADL